MARNLVGALVRVGYGELSHEEVVHALRRELAALEFVNMNDDGEELQLEENDDGDGETSWEEFLELMQSMFHDE